jgi:hypothetical protein
MKTQNPFRSAAIMLLFVLFASMAQGEQSTDLGDAVVHYNAVRTDFFDPQIAKAYGIKRSKNRALLTITVLKKRMGLASQPARAQVSAKAVNLSKQVKKLNVREIADGRAIYYIAEFPITNKETLDFTVQVTPEGGQQETLSFRQRFVTY